MSPFTVSVNTVSVHWCLGPILPLFLFPFTVLSLAFTDISSPSFTDITVLLLILHNLLSFFHYCPLHPISWLTLSTIYVHFILVSPFNLTLNSVSVLCSLYFYWYFTVFCPSSPTMIKHPERTTMDWCVGNFQCKWLFTSFTIINH